MTDVEALYRKYFRDIYLMLLGLSHDEKLSEDLTAETFRKAMENLDSFRGQSDIKAWLCRIGRNSFYSHLRKSRRLTALEDADAQPDGTDIEKTVTDRESSEKIHRILHGMAEPYKEVFSLRCFGELSFREIGALFGKTENWACVTYHRARKKIRDGLEEKK